MTPATAPPGTTFLFPLGSSRQDRSTFWRWPPWITNAQMRIGGESDPDSDVLQLVAGVKNKMLLQTLVCMHYCIHACMHTSVPLCVLLNVCPSAHHVFAKPRSRYMWPGMGGLGLIILPILPPSQAAHLPCHPVTDRSAHKISLLTLSLLFNPQRDQDHQHPARPDVCICFKKAF